ncbi:hypothetical protein V6C03_10780 [Methyloligella sp. 2.7D]|uniref:hypothetical protein n=1 Tax=unclassified Methyloligella TaxID=2625955 RepID=UPI00157D31CC|nr:hypothetical protein [Methyloligella sp. GL2]QKP77690.1 hypothetical protein HT051_09680 [Methyloligella sp. GL2]
MNGQNKKRAIVHAGLPKTATSTIQNACFEEREMLRKHAGIVYPGSDPAQQLALRTIFSDTPHSHPSSINKGKHNRRKLRAELDQTLAALTAEIEQSDAPVVLLSNEALTNFNAGELTRFREWLARLVDSIEIFYVVREPVAYATSAMQQILKQGRVLEEMYVNPPKPLFQQRLSLAMELFGADNVKALSFEAMCAHEKGVMGAFLDFLGVTDGTARSALMDAAQSKNSSLSDEAAQILSSLNRQRPPIVNGRKARNRALPKEIRTLGRIGSAKFRPPRAVAKKIFDETRADVAWLKENFGVGGYDEIDLDRYRDGPILTPELADSLALTISDLINRQKVLFDPDRGIARMVSERLHKLDFWVSGNLPGLKRWYR